MFVEEKAKGEVEAPMLGTLKFSTAIREGAARYPEVRACYIEAGGACCAIGAAAKVTGFVVPDGMYGRCAHRIYDHLAEQFPGVPRDTMSFASGKHAGGMSREEVAAWLEEQGY